MIEADDLRKAYGDVVAVADASFRVDPGEIFGLIGLNGAGKTTTVKTLCGPGRTDRRDGATDRYVAEDIVELGFGHTPTVGSPGRPAGD